jgi:hypothetical protein
VPAALAVLAVTAVAASCQQEPEPEQEPQPLDLTASVGEEPVLVPASPSGEKRTHIDMSPVMCGHQVHPLETACFNTPCTRKSTHRAL